MRAFTLRESLKNDLDMGLGVLPFLLRPRAPLERTRRWQLGRLRALVDHAARNVPFYRVLYTGVGYRPGDLRSLDDLRHLPLVTKQQMLDAEPGELLDERLDPDSLLASHSSGSTGVSLRVFHQSDRVGMQALALFRMFNMGVRYLPWHRHVYLYTSPFPAESVLGLYPTNFIHTLAPMDETRARLQELRPAILSCYPSHLRELLRAGELGFTPRGVWVNSEMSSQRERDDMERVLGCPVFDEYSSEELTRIASQCSHKRYHLYEDICFTEILDEAGAPARSGEVVGSYLHNLAMPFIRYRQGDLAAVRESDCPCGRRFRILEDLVGRQNDRFLLPSGRVLSSGWLLDASYGFLMDLDVAAFRMIQQTRDHVRVEIMPGPTLADDAEGRIAAQLRDQIGEPLRIEVVRTAELERTASGKLNPIVSKVREVSE